jgi:hypothetical protein
MMWPDCAVGDLSPTPHSDGRGNVWLGTSIATQADADRNIPELLKCRDLAAKLFVSAEPLLGPVDLSRLPIGPNATIHALAGVANCQGFGGFGPGIDWLIVGGESGPKARPCHIEWVRDLTRQCRAANVSCFVKQLGANPIADEAFADWQLANNVDQFCSGLSGRRILKHPKGGDASEWPDELRIQEVPA